MIHISAKHKKILVPHSTALANIFPDAKVLTHEGNQLIALDHEPDVCAFLKNIGLNVPAPIIHQYNWAGGSPFHIQKITASLLSTNKRAYVLNSFGTGKTKSALWAWHYLYSAGLAKKLLVVAPLSTLTFTWAAEVFRTLSGLKVQVLHGSREKRLARLNDDSADIYVINHDGLATVHAELVKRKDINVLCIDELAAYRNNSDRTKLMRKYAASMEWVWGMTGSPTPNAPTDAWNQATIITPHTVPKYFNRFREDVMQKVTQFKWIPRPDAINKVYAALQPAVRFTLDDVMELPAKVERFQDVELGAEQKRVYDAMAQHARVAVQNGEIDAMNAGAVLSKLLQISTGYVYKRDQTVVSLDNNKRIEATIDAINAAEGKIIVFAPFKHALAGIADAIKKEGHDFEIVSGDTPAKSRDDIFSRFQNTKEIRVLVAHPKCMAHGLNLTAASTVIWFGPIADLEIFDQANARITRVGQTRRQLVLYLQSTKAEKHTYKKLLAKQKIQNTLLDMFEEGSNEQ